MQPNRLGRVLGIGTRVATLTLRDRAAQSASAASRHSSVSSPAAVSARYTDATRRLGRGTRQAGAAFLRPFAHASGILWNQIVGIFFAIFALFFLTHSWQAFRSAGLHDRHWIVYGVLGLLFSWFTLSSFWRAHRKQQQTSR